MAFLAQVTYTGNGSTTQYSIPFEFIDSTHVKAFIDGTETSAFTISSSTLTFTTAPANASVVRIERQTPTDARLIDFTDGSVLTESDLDRSADQNFYIAQEITDDSASKLGLDTDDKYDANNKVIKNLANPVNNNDAVNKTYLENTWLSASDKTTLNNINANIANINAVNSNEANINSVNSNEANINTVATNIGSVNTVATDIAKVITVANDLAEAVSEVETVADDLNEATSEIDTVANNITNVNTVGTNIANVNTVAGISANVTTVAGNNANVSTVAGISGNVTTVAGISSDVTSVANDATDIGTVATDIANVNTVAGISGNVTTVAGISSNVTSVANNSANINSVAGNATNINTVAGNNSNITTVAGISSNVTTVAGISSDVTAVAGDATDIGTVATNLTGTNTIGTVAGSITNVNNVGGSIANVNTVATNIASVNNFGEVYRISATAPTTSLDAGDLYFDTATDTLKVYGSSGWQNAGSSVNGTSQRYNYTATSGQTTFTGADNNGNTLTYDAGYIDVYLNGVKLLNGTDVTVTSGSSVVLASGATTGDIVDIVAYGTFSVASLNADNLDSGTIPDARFPSTLPAIDGSNLTGIASVGGATGVDFNDNVEARFGTGNDLKIFHDGSDSRIEDRGTGNLILGSNGTGVEIRRKTDSADEAMIIANNNGSVDLYYDNSKKFETTSTGINITGGVRLGGNNASNELDDYEEGTWTPTINSGTFSSSNTKYTKIGNKVTVTAVANNFSDQTGGSRVEIGGLPYTPNQSNTAGSLIGRYMNFASSASYVATTGKVYFYDVNSGGYDFLEFSDFNNASAEIIFIATYFTDS